MGKRATVFLFVLLGFLILPSSAVAQTTSPNSVENRVHLVVRGEGLIKIARRYRGRELENKFRDIAYANKIRGPQFTIYPGQKLIIPPLPLHVEQKQKNRFNATFPMLRTKVSVEVTARYSPVSTSVLPLIIDTSDELGFDHEMIVQEEIVISSRDLERIEIPKPTLHSRKLNTIGVNVGSVSGLEPLPPPINSRVLDIGHNVSPAITTTFISSQIASVSTVKAEDDIASSSLDQGIKLPDIGKISDFTKHSPANRGGRVWDKVLLGADIGLIGLKILDTESTQYRFSTCKGCWEGNPRMASIAESRWATYGIHGAQLLLIKFINSKIDQKDWPEWLKLIPYIISGIQHGRAGWGNITLAERWRREKNKKK